MNHFDRIWNRLTDLARSALAADLADDVAPPGFATRVAANWVALRRDGAGRTLLEWLAVRGLAVACALTVLAAIASWSSVQDQPAEDIATLADPLVSELLAP